MEQRIEIEIDPDGKLSAKTEGLKGETCIEEIQKLFEDLVVIIDYKKTDEFFQQVNIDSRNKQTNQLGKG